MLTVRIQKQLTHFTLHTQFQVDEEIVVLFGPSGSGKTTILNCIAGLTKPEDGSITLNDRTFFESGKTYIPTQGRNVGYLFQDYALFPHMTVWNNIIYGMRNEGLAKQFMNDLQIGHLKDQFPHQISGGEKQRVAITRAIATDRKSTRLNSSHVAISYAVFCLKKKKKKNTKTYILRKLDIRMTSPLPLQKPT